MHSMVQGVSKASRGGFGPLINLPQRWLKRGGQSESGIGLNHGLTEDELRALIAEDLRAFVRRPLAGANDGGARPSRPFLLDRLICAGI
jgi:hypothetical protein